MSEEVKTIKKFVCLEKGWVWHQVKKIGVRETPELGKPVGRPIVITHCGYNWNASIWTKPGEQVGDTSDDPPSFQRRCVRCARRIARAKEFEQIKDKLT